MCQASRYVVIYNNWFLTLRVFADTVISPQELSCGDKGTSLLLCSCSQGPWPGEPPSLSWPSHRHQAPPLGDPVSPGGRRVLRTVRSLHLTFLVIIPISSFLHFQILFPQQNSQKVESLSPLDIRSQKTDKLWLCGVILFLAMVPFPGIARPCDRAWSFWFTLRMRLYLIIHSCLRIAFLQRDPKEETLLSRTSLLSGRLCCVFLYQQFNHSTAEVFPSCV